MRNYLRYTLIMLAMFVLTLDASAQKFTYGRVTNAAPSAQKPSFELHYDKAETALTLTWPKGTAVALGSASATLEGFSGVFSLIENDENSLIAYLDLPNGNYTLNIPENAIIVNNQPMPATTYPFTVNSSATGNGWNETIFSSSTWASKGEAPNPIVINTNGVQMTTVGTMFNGEDMNVGFDIYDTKELNWKMNTKLVFTPQGDNTITKIIIVPADGSENAVQYASASLGTYDNGTWTGELNATASLTLTANDGINISKIIVCYNGDNGDGTDTDDDQPGTIIINWPENNHILDYVPYGGKFVTFTTNKEYAQVTVELKNNDTRWRKDDLPVRMVDNAGEKSDNLHVGENTIYITTPGEKSWYPYKEDSYTLVVKGYVHMWDAPEDYDAVAEVNIIGNGKNHPPVSDYKLISFSPITATDLNPFETRNKLTTTRDNIITLEFDGPVASVTAITPAGFQGETKTYQTAKANEEGTLWNITVPGDAIEDSEDGNAGSLTIDVTAADANGTAIVFNYDRTDFGISLMYDATREDVTEEDIKTLGTPAFSIVSGTLTVDPSTESILMTFPQAKGFDRNTKVSAKGTLSSRDKSQPVTVNTSGTMGKGIVIPVKLSDETSYNLEITELGMSETVTNDSGIQTEVVVGSFKGNWSTYFATGGIDTGSGTQTETTLAFSNGTATIAAGQTLQLTATSNVPNAPIVYSSSDEAIATVDAQTGLVTAVAAGNVTITAYIAETDNYTEATAFCDVTVTPAQTFALVESYPAANQKMKNLYGETFKFVFNEPVKRVQITVVDNTTGESVTSKIAEVKEASTTIQYTFDSGQPAMYALSPAHKYSVNWIAYYSYNSIMSNKKAGEGSIRIIGDDENAAIISPTVEFESIDHDPDTFVFNDADGRIDHIDIKLTFKGEGKVASVEAWVQVAQQSTRPQQATISEDGKTVTITVSTADAAGSGACSIFVRAKDADGHIIGAPGETVNPNNGYLQFSYASEIGLPAPSLVYEDQTVDQIAELKFVNTGGISLNMDASGTWSKIQVVDKQGNIIETNFRESQFVGTGGGNESYTTMTLTLSKPIVAGGQYAVILPYAAFVLGQQLSARLNGSKTYSISVDGSLEPARKTLLGNAVFSATSDGIKITFPDAEIPANIANGEVTLPGGISISDGEVEYFVYPDPAPLPVASSVEFFVSFSSLVISGYDIKPGDLTITINGYEIIDYTESFFGKTIETVDQPISGTVTISTGIDIVKCSIINGDKTFSISGQPVKTAKAGVYIINGKKIAVK